MADKTERKKRKLEEEDKIFHGQWTDKNLMGHM
jgi:hypothetical protein